MLIPLILPSATFYKSDQEIKYSAKVFLELSVKAYLCFLKIYILRTFNIVTDRKSFSLLGFHFKVAAYGFKLYAYSGYYRLLELPPDLSGKSVIPGF